MLDLKKRPPAPTSVAENHHAGGPNTGDLTLGDFDYSVSHLASSLKMNLADQRMKTNDKS